MSPAIPRKDSVEYGGSADGHHVGVSSSSGSTPAIDYSYYSYDPHASSYWGNATGWEGYGAMADAYYGAGHAAGASAAAAVDPHQAYGVGAAGTAHHQPGGYGDASAAAGAGAGSVAAATAASMDDDMYDEYALVGEFERRF